VPKEPFSFKEKLIDLRDVLKLMWSDMTRLDILKQSSAMAYVTLISIVPSLAAVFTIISIFKPLLGGGSKVSDSIKQFVIQNLAEGTGSSVSDTLDKLISNLSLTQIGVTSFASLLISLILLLRQIEQALNRIWMVRQERSMITRFVYFWTILTLGTFLVSLIFGYLSTFGLTNFMAELKGQKSDIFHNIIGYSTSLVGGFSIFFFIYKVIPNTEVKLKDAAIGALFSAVALGIAGDFFSYYVKYFSKNSVLYGAIGALPLFLTWLYICWVIIMVGALITWRFEQGFKVEKEESELFKPTSFDSLYDQKTLECFIPNICLVLIYEKFWNESKGGLKFEEIQEKIHVPSTWIRDSLDLLIEKNYIALAQINSSPEYIAARPPEKISVTQIKSDFMPTLGSKIYGWESLMDSQIAKKTQMILKNDSDKTMLASFL
jgi:membrane protein